MVDLDDVEIITVKPENFEKVAELMNRSVSEVERIYEADCAHDHVRFVYVDRTVFKAFMETVDPQRWYRDGE